MSISCIRLAERSDQRLRLTFDNALAGSAFSRANYQVNEAYDYGDTNPQRIIPVSAAIVIAIDGQSVDLALGEKTTAGAWIWVTFLVPIAAVDSSTISGDSETIKLSAPLPAATPELPPTDVQDALWGRDISWSDGDWNETADGDLDTIGGLPNVTGAVERRWMSEGLQWDQSYGLRPRRYVDAPAVIQNSLLGQAQAQATADDRVATALATLSSDPSDPSTIFIAGNIRFVGGDTDSVSAKVSAGA